MDNWIKVGNRAVNLVHAKFITRHPDGRIVVAFDSRDGFLVSKEEAPAFIVALENAGFPVPELPRPPNKSHDV